MIKITAPDFNSIRDELQKALSELKTDDFVTVGIHEDENARAGDVMTNAKLGAIQHFGNDKIPSRPWLDVGVASVNEEITETIADAIEDGLPLEQALNQVGVVAVAGVQEYMTDLSSPANAESTIARKGSDNPLIDTGELRQSVNYKITSGEPSEGL